MKMKCLWGFHLVAVALAHAWACHPVAAARGGSDDDPIKTPHKVTCTVGMVADIVRQISGDKATVEGIIGEGVDPHLNQATRSYIAKLLKADVVFYSGLMLEGKMADALIKAARKRPVYALTELVDRSLLSTTGNLSPVLSGGAFLWRRLT